MQYDWDDSGNQSEFQVQTKFGRRTALQLIGAGGAAVLAAATKPQLVRHKQSNVN